MEQQIVCKGWTRYLQWNNKSYARVEPDIYNGKTNRMQRLNHIFTMEQQIVCKGRTTYLQSNSKSYAKVEPYICKKMKFW